MSDMNARGGWFILDGDFFPAGRRVSGPYSTREDALTARVAIEARSRGITFWIDRDTPAAEKSAPALVDEDAATGEGEPGFLTEEDFADRWANAR